MKRQILAAMALALTPSLVACGPTAPPASGGTAALPAAGAGAGMIDRIDAIDSKYRAAKAFFDVLLAPFVPVDRLNRVRVLERTIERAIAGARIAASLADQMRAIRAAEAAVAELEATN